MPLRETLAPFYHKQIPEAIPAADHIPRTHPGEACGTVTPRTRRCLRCSGAAHLPLREPPRQRCTLWSRSRLFACGERSTLCSSPQSRFAIFLVWRRRRAASLARGQPAVPAMRVARRFARDASRCHADLGLTPSSHRLSSFCFPPVVSRGLRKLIPVGYCRRALTPRMARKLARWRGALAAALACVAILACVFARIRASLLVPPSGQVLAQRTSSKKCPDDPSLCGPRKPSGMSEKEFQKQLKLRKAIMKTEVRLRDHVRHAPSRPPSPPHAHSQSCTQACSGKCRRSPHWVWR